MIRNSFNENFKNNIKNILISLLIFIVGTIFLIKILGIKIYFIICLICSSIAIYFLSKIKNIFGSYMIIGIFGFNIMLLIFSIIPTYNKEVNISGFYNQKQNILNIELKDSKEYIQNNLAKILIKNPLHNTKEINLYDNNPFVVINSGDTIIYISRTKELESIVNIQLWDGSIIRILPQSIVKVNKLLKDNNDLLSSKTEIEVEKGNIWFRVIRTIFDKDGFNVKTDNGTIVIRGTSGIISEKDGTNYVYSYDHIIELISEKGNLLIGKGESAKLTDNIISKINSEELFNNIGNKIYDKISIFNELDMKDITQYKSDILSYVNKNFSWSLDNSNFLKSFSEYKLSILTKLDPSRYGIINSNYEKYKYLIGGGENIKYSENNKDILITPTTDSESFMDIKLEYLKNMGSVNTQAMESYIINSYNKILDQGKSIDIDGISNKIQDFTTNSAQKIQEIYFENK